MQFTDQDLRAAVTAGALDADRLNPLLDFLSARATSCAGRSRRAARSISRICSGMRAR